MSNRKELPFIRTNKEFSIGQTVVYYQRAKTNFTLFKKYQILAKTETNHLLVRNDKGRFEVANINCFVSIPTDRKRKIKNFLKLERLGLV